MHEYNMNFGLAYLRKGQTVLKYQPLVISNSDRFRREINAII